MRRILVLLLLISSLSLFSQNSASFRSVVLGCKGGVDQSNLSCYLLSAANSKYFICLDGGSIVTGLKKGLALGSFDHLNLNHASDTSLLGQIIYNNITSYYISHPHLDHSSGMLLLSPDDNKKNLYISPFTWEALRNNIFNWKIWANFTNKGIPPRLNRYKINLLEFGQEFLDQKSGLRAKAFPLSHGAHFESTAFLVFNGDDAILYFGDTGADRIEAGEQLKKIWKEVAPLVVSGNLKGVFLECSYLRDRPDHLLFGHLRTDLFLEELAVLAQFVSPDQVVGSLKGLKVVVTHLKPNLIGLSDEEQIKKVREEFKAGEALGCEFIIPYQGQLIEF